METKQSRILVVDDLYENQLILQRLLQREEYEVMIAENGIDAIEKSLELMPDLILMDVMMPIMDGFEACRLIKNNNLTNHIPIIFLTALSETEKLAEAFEVGGTDYIAKPFKALELKARVKSAILLKQAQDLNKEYIQSLETSNIMLNEAHDKLHEINAHKDRFFSIISHDLKNPLQGILGLSEIISENGEILDKEDIISTAKEIFEASTHLHKLLHNLLDWSRLQMNKLTINFKIISLKELITNAYEPLKINFESKNINFAFNPEIDIFQLADNYTLEAVIRNILANAIKFTNANGLIEIKLFKNEEWNIIEISDNGIGMDKETQNSLFMINQNASKLGTEKEEGTGLGLMLCKEFIEKNNGRIEVESELHKGSIFRIILQNKLI